MDTAITITAAIGFFAGAMSIGMWLGPDLSRVRTERDRLQSVVDGLRKLVGKHIAQIRDLSKQLDRHRSDADAMTDKIAKLTAECVEFQRLAHQAQDGLDMAKDMLSSEIVAHRTTKRQLAAAKGQITKLRKSLE